MGLAGVRKCHTDMAAVAKRRGHGNPPPGVAGPLAILPAKSGPFPPPTSARGGPGLLDGLSYRLYGMYLAVLVARMAASQADQPVHGDSFFPEQLLPRPRNPYPWDDFVGPLPGDIVRHQPCRAAVCAHTCRRRESTSHFRIVVSTLTRITDRGHP